MWKVSSSEKTTSVIVLRPLSANFRILLSRFAEKFWHPSTGSFLHKSWFFSLEQFASGFVYFHLQKSTKSHWRTCGKLGWLSYLGMKSILSHPSFFIKFFKFLSRIFEYTCWSTITWSIFVLYWQHSSIRPGAVAEFLIASLLCWSKPTFAWIAESEIRLVFHIYFPSAKEWTLWYFLFTPEVDRLHKTILLQYSRSHIQLARIFSLSNPTVVIENFCALSSPVSVPM